MKRFAPALLTVCVVGLAPGIAAAQARYDIPNINFDLWCQETKHLPPERCDKRLPQDDAEYQAYVDTIDKYAVPYQQERQRRIEVNRDILNNDPLESPTDPQPPANQPAKVLPPPK